MARFPINRQPDGVCDRDRYEVGGKDRRHDQFLQMIVWRAENDETENYIYSMPLQNEA
jgi:hypothetical protein